MQLPSVNAGSEVYLAHGDHLEGAVEAWTGMSALTSSQQQTVSAVGEQIRIANQGLRQAMQLEHDATRTMRKARARYYVCDAVLDLRLMATSDALLNGPAMRSRQHPTYHQVFGGQAASEITGAKMREEPELVGRVLEQLKGLEDFSGKQAVQDALADALAMSLQARDALEDAEQAANTAGDSELSARLSLRTVLEQCYGTLRAAFPGRRDFVESFFHKVERGGKEPAAAPAPASESTVG